MPLEASARSSFAGNAASDVVRSAASLPSMEPPSLGAASPRLGRDAWIRSSGARCRCAVVGGVLHSGDGLPVRHNVNP